MRTWVCNGLSEIDGCLKQCWHVILKAAAQLGGNTQHQRKLQSPSAEQASALLRWFDTLRLPAEWGLTVDEQVGLLGGVTKRTFQGWKKKALEGQPVKLSRDTMERLILLLGIYEGLKMIAPADRMDVAKQWFNTANSNPLFGGVSPKKLLLTVGTVESLYAVRYYLDAARR